MPNLNNNKNNLLLSILKKEKLDEEYLSEFVHFLRKNHESIIDDNNLKEEELESSIVELAIEYIQKFDIELKKGHGKEWAGLYAENIEEHLNAFYDTFRVINSTNTQLALEELTIHCKDVGGDELYTKHFIFLMKNGEGLSDPDDQAKAYSEIFKEQISLGKSEIFAHHFADIKACGKYLESYAFSFANSFEIEIKKGKTEKYALLYASKIAEYYGNKYSLIKNIGYTENDRLNEICIAGYVKGWEYASNNKINNSYTFIKIFETEYTNAHYRNLNSLQSNEEEFDKNVLEKTLQIFNNL